MPNLYKVWSNGKGSYDIIVKRTGLIFIKDLEYVKACELIDFLNSERQLKAIKEANDNKNNLPE